MGVPKFYRWLSERYPLINQKIGDASLLPEFGTGVRCGALMGLSCSADNLYLDMNGILHNATHGDAGIEKKKSDRDILLRTYLPEGRALAERQQKSVHRLTGPSRSPNQLS